MKARRAWGTIYRPKGRDGSPTRWWWLKFRFPGDPEPRRMVTSPRTDDENEARRQLHERLGERDYARRQRQRVEDVLVADLLGLYVADCLERGIPLQKGRVEPWVDALGTVPALEVDRVMIDAICARWKRVGPTWGEGCLQIPGFDPLMWAARDPRRVRPIGGANCNRLIAVGRRAYHLGREMLGLMTPLTFPHFEETARGEYITEAQCLTICANLQAKGGASVKADLFRLGYLLGVRKGQLTRTQKRHVLIQGDTWKLRWPGEETKNGKPHEVVLRGEAAEIVQRAWVNRRPDCDFLFHVNGRRIGPMRSELQRTCALLGIPYGRGRGIVWHDTRHSAVTNLIDAGVPQATAMTVTGHVTDAVFERYHVRRDVVQADALDRVGRYLEAQRASQPEPEALTAGQHDIRARRRARQD
jgi:hypothetical protein